VRFGRGVVSGALGCHRGRGALGRGRALCCALGREPGQRHDAHLVEGNVTFLKEVGAERLARRGVGLVVAQDAQAPRGAVGAGEVEHVGGVEGAAERGAQTSHPERVEL